MHRLYSRYLDKMYSKLRDVFAQNQNKAYYIYIWCIDIRRYKQKKTDKIFG